MENYIRVLLFLSVILLVNGCGNKEPNKTAGKKGEVYLTAGLKVRTLTNKKFESTPQRIARGKYLTNGASHCFMCHSLRDWSKHSHLLLNLKKEAGQL